MERDLFHDLFSISPEPFDYDPVAAAKYVRDLLDRAFAELPAAATSSDDDQQVSPSCGHIFRKGETIYRCR